LACEDLFPSRIQLLTLVLRARFELFEGVNRKPSGGELWLISWRVPPCLDWLQTPSRTAQAFSAAFDCSHSLRTHKMWRFELAVAFLSFFCIAPSIRAKALSRQKYPGRCVSTACFAREG